MLQQSRRALLLATTYVLLQGLPALAQDFPSRPIKFIVPFAAGSITDVSARYYARQLTTLAGQAVIVDNRPGANGLNGVNALLNAPADGYTVLIGTTSTLATNLALYKKLPYDPVADFAPLGMMSTIPTVIVTNTQSSIATLQQLIEAAKTVPGKLNYSAGATSYQLMGELFNERSSVKTAFIPYKGSSEALNAVLGQQVDFSVLDMSTALASIKGGKLRALAVAGEQRSSLLPDVPTAAEAGVPGYVASTWVAGVVSAKTPKAELDRLQKWFAQIAAQPETKAFHHGIGADVTAGGPAKLQEIQRQSIEVWKRVAANARIKQL